ncbi:MAG: hypothetical protein F9K45_04290 [Melioribacteraceae bacterium]|nr:MAG: hypothetical protein F9K45_04290 [Melioribacteraceae bacterium]
MILFINNVSDSLKTAAAKSNVFKEITFAPEKLIDGNGLFISVVGYVIVFAALLMLSIFISKLKDTLALKQRKKLKETGHRAANLEDLSVPEETNAAIAMAIHLYFADVHDMENTVLTIKKVQRPYSPWSSKIYGLRQSPKK